MLYWVRMLQAKCIRMLQTKYNNYTSFPQWKIYKKRTSRLFTSIRRRRRRETEWSDKSHKSMLRDDLITSYVFITWHITSNEFKWLNHHDQSTQCIKDTIAYIFLYSMDRKYLVFSSYALVFCSFLTHQ